MECVSKEIHFLPIKKQQAEIVGGSDGKESACNAGDLGLIPKLGRSPGKGNGNYPSILAGGFHEQRLQSMGLQRVGYD